VLGGEKHKCLRHQARTSNKPRSDEESWNGLQKSYSRPIQIDRWANNSRECRKRALLQADERMNNDHHLESGLGNCRYTYLKRRRNHFELRLAATEGGANVDRAPLILVRKKTLRKSVDYTEKGIQKKPKPPADALNEGKK